MFDEQIKQTYLGKWRQIAHHFISNQVKSPSTGDVYKRQTDDRIAKFFKDKGYDTEDDKLDAGKTTWFLKVIVGIVLSVGLLISVLSFYILMLSIYSVSYTHLDVYKRQTL